MSTTGKGWQSFLESLPDRAREVVEHGPMPLLEYDGKVTFKDKKAGLVKFKGGNGRGRVNIKSGKQAVVYFDPDFCWPEMEPLDVPDSVLERHSMNNVIDTFEEM